jgi:hypothetical protein
MKSNLFFYLGAGIDVLVFLVSISNLFMIDNPVQGLDGQSINTQDGMTGFGKMALWLIPFALLAIIGIGFWLRSNGKLLAANILVWIPALPMLIATVVVGGLAVLFILFGK